MDFETVNQLINEGCGSIASASKPHDSGDLIGRSPVRIDRLRVASAT
jgi:hypothetical protein